MLSNEERAGYGYEALRAGAPDSARPGEETEAATHAGDAIANILHYLFSQSTEDSLDVREQNALAVLESGRRHFKSELRGDC